MTQPLFHAESSVRLWGGRPEDYLAVHDWLDATKACFADFRHRALRHHAFGIFEAERTFGAAIVNAAGRIVPVRYVAEQHIKEDCGGRVPSVGDWLTLIRPQPWMSRGYPTDTRLAELADPPAGCASSSSRQSCSTSSAAASQPLPAISSR